jgi:hypothetical protein
MIKRHESDDSRQRDYQEVKQQRIELQNLMMDKH